MKYSVKLNGTCYEVEVTRIDDDFRAMTKGEVSGETTPLPAAVAVPPPAKATPPAAPSGAGSQAGRLNIVCPMPGKVLGLKAVPGQAVKSGQTLVIIEAMKMENEIVAPVDGVVESFLVKSGDSVDTDAILAVLRPAV